MVFLLFVVKLFGEDFSFHSCCKCSGRIFPFIGVASVQGGFFPSIGVSDLELAYYVFDYCGVYGLVNIMLRDSLYLQT